MSPRALLGLAVGVVVAVSAPLLWGDGVDVPDDAAYYGVAAWEWLALAARDGLNPWWVPGKLGGVSLFSDVIPQGPFYPTVLLALVLPVVPALGLAALLHAVGTLFAVRWLARVHGVRDELATLAGAAVSAGPLGVWAALDFQVDAWPTFLWFPVALGCMERAADGVHRRRWIAAGAAAVGLLLLGSHLRVAIGAGAALAAWSVIRGRDLRGAAAIGGLGLLAGAPLLVPMLLEASLQSAGSSPFSAPNQAIGGWNVAGWLAPKATLDARDLGIGAVLGIGLLAAAVLLPERRRAAAWIGLLLVAGSHLPGVRFLLAPLTALATPVTLVYAALALIPAAVLGAAGLERLVESRGAGPHRVVQLTVAFLVLAVARLALGRWTMVSPEAWLQYGLAILQLAVVIGGLRFALRGRDPIPLLVLVALLDLGAFGLRAHLAVPARPLRATSQMASPELLSLGFLDVEDLANGFDGPGGEPVEEDVAAPRTDAPEVQARIIDRTWPVHACMATGCRGLAGRSKMAPARMTALLAPVADALADLEDAMDVVAHVFGDDSLGRRALELTGTPIAMKENVVVAVVPQERRSPRCFLVDRVAVVPDRDARIERLLAEPWWERPRLVEEEVAASSGASLECTDPVAGAQVTGAPALVAAALPLHPGWTVEQDGARLAPIAVDQVLQAVTVPNDGLVRWRFVPPGLQAGLIVGVFAWLLILGLGRIRPGRAASALLALAFLVPTAASAAPLQGTVADAPRAGTAEAWLLTSLDLTRGDQPRARAPVVDGRFTLDVPAGEHGDAWIFLRQEVPLPGRPPLVFHRPMSLDPFDLAQPPASVRISAVPEDLAQRRALGQAPPGWWTTPLLLTLLVLVGAPLLRRRLQRDLPGVTVRPAQAAPRADVAAPAAPGRAERRGLAAILLGAAALRLPGFTAPLDLLEWSYGPGTSRVRTGDETAWADLLDAVLHPACLELVHPPLWHLLMQGLDLVGGGREWLLRAPALAASVATCWAVWLLARRHRPTTGLLAAAACAVATPAVEFGRDATPYAFLGLVAAGSLVLLLRALQLGTPRAWALWLGLLVLGFLSHYATALFAGAQILILLYLWLVGRDPRWRGAAIQALRVGPVVGSPALAWTFLHFANFSPVALDTRLYADTYPLDPGLVAFVSDFGAVGLGVAPVFGVFALPAAVLVLWGLQRAAFDDRQLGLALAAIVGAFAGGTLFFYANLLQSLDGRVFWGFRWVSWFLPVAMVLGAWGVMASQGLGRVVAAVLGLGWLWGTGSTAIDPAAASTHPDFRAAAQTIAEQLEDRDGLVALPMWAQRGPVRTYLARALEGELTTIHDTTAWDFGGRAAYLEAGDERLPFESGVINTHTERIWLVIADERMFGRAKFSAPIAERALAWADAHLDRETTIELPNLTLIRYRRRPLPIPPSVHPGDLQSRPYLEPNTTPCGDADEPSWAFHVRLDGEPDGVRLHHGEILAGHDERGWAAIVEGGSCDGPAPRVGFGPSGAREDGDQIP